MLQLPPRRTAHPKRAPAPNELFHPVYVFESKMRRFIKENSPGRILVVELSQVDHFRLVSQPLKTVIITGFVGQKSNLTHVRPLRRPAHHVLYQLRVVAKELPVRFSIRGMTKRKAPALPVFKTSPNDLVSNGGKRKRRFVQQNHDSMIPLRRRFQLRYRPGNLGGFFPRRGMSE